MMGSFYDDFAESFSNKRKNPWKDFVDFIKSLEMNEKFQDCINNGVWCDLGAGNGRHLPILIKYAPKYVGTDLSFQLLQIARSKNDPFGLHNWVACDVNALPFRKKTFQSIVSVAVFHHILEKTKLRQILMEVMNIMASGGIFILTLWGVYGGKNASAIKRKNFHRRISKMEVFDSCKGSDRYKLEANDLLIPWKQITKGNKISINPRIYHLYTFNELNIYEEKFAILKRESKHIGENAGINYFLCLTPKHS